MINIQNSEDNECFKWPLVRYLNIADHNPTRMKKLTKILLIRDIPNIKKTISLALVFLVEKMRKNTKLKY